MISDGESNLADTAADSSAEDSLRPAAPRRAVPTTFNPIINDEANILAAITRGDRTLFDLAEEHETTVTNLCIWLQREDIQQKLNDLSTCGAQLTRVAAVNQLPKAVKAMAFQIEAHIFDRTHNLIKPGLATDKVAALRDANARKACNLLLRLAKFDPAQPLYRAPKLLPRQGEVSPKATEGARSPGPDGGAVERSETEGALLLASASAPSSDLPDLLSLCAAALSAAKQAHESRIPAITEPERGGRTPEPAVLAFTSDFPHPVSDFSPLARRANARCHGSASRSDAQPVENHRLNTSAPWADEAVHTTPPASARPPPH